MNKIQPGPILAAALVALAAWVVHDFLEAILAACVLAVASWPLYTRLAALLPRRMPRGAAPIVFTCGLAVFVLAPLVFACWALLVEAHALVDGLAAADRASLALPGWLAGTPVVGRWLAARWHPDTLLLLTQSAEPQAVLGWAQSVGQFTSRHLLTTAFTILLLCFLFRDGGGIGRALTRALRRRVGEQADGYVDVATRAVRAAIGSMLAVALFDGVAAACVYAIAGVPRPLAWGAITGALAAVPFVGYVAVAALVLELAVQGPATAAVPALVLGSLVLLAGDKLVRPLVARGGIRLPFVWVLMACVGGFGVLGLSGLVIGPVVISLARELWEQWMRASA